MSLLFYNLLGVKPNGFGLEIEDRSLKAFMFSRKKRGQCKVLSCGMRPLAKGLIQGGLIKDPRAVASEIKKLAATTKPKPISSKFVVFSVPETKAFIRTISIPKMEREEAEEAVKWETEANIPIAADKVYLDWQIINDEGTSDEILVTAIPKEIVDSYFEAITLAGLDTLAIEVDIIATIRCLAGDDKMKEKPVMIIDLGEDKTSLAISKNEVPYFTSSLPLCGRSFTDALQKGLGVSFEKAEEFKVRYGLGKMKEDDMLFNVYNPLIENLALEIERSISFYEESINTKEKVDMIIFSGGGSLLRDLAGHMAGRLKRNIIIGDSLKLLGVGNNFSPELRKGLVPFATTIGLALRACKDYD